MLELYHHDISVCAQKVRLSLDEKNLAWEPHHVDLMASERVSPSYLALNPKGVLDPRCDVQSGVVAAP